MRDVCGPEATFVKSELVEDLVDPEPLQPAESLVEVLEGTVVEATDLVDGLEVAVIELVDHFGDLFALRRQADAHRAPISRERSWKM